RGASLITAISQDLGRAGVWVDHLTSLDPHPVDGENDFFGVDYGDDEMASFDNIAFADDYWRSDGNANDFDFDGEPVTGAHQGNLNNSVQQNFISSAHGAVTAYYVGTIDTDTSDGGDHPVLSDWYGTTSAKPARTATGFRFSRIAGGARPSNGVSTLLGGSGSRVAAGQSGSQWANGFDLTSLNGTALSAGQTLETRLTFVDRDSSANVFLYLDSNKNPYDGANYLTRKGFTSTSPVKARINAPTAGLTAGSYYLVARITDAAGHSRFTYMRTAIQITTPNFANLSSGMLVVNGTDGNDTMAMSESGSTITATLNGVTQTFDRADVTRIEVYAGTGNDVVNAGALVQAAYVNGGPGRDNITGGSGNDTLSGGAQSNTLTGGLGDDVLNGSAGNDLMDAQGGYDRLYSNGGLDTMSGGSNVDRLFGSDGNEYMIGGRGNDKMYAYGGNDTLIGGQDSDILDGSDGTDTSDTDAADTRISIEVLS
ncbi:MAG: hypothetical protein H7144_13945, partial [Burkholderiales bacterium]|nr:hypothetical protein [Phycisphaerae bacterium]